MSDKRTFEQRVALGDWAKQLLDDPNFKAVCNGIVADSLAAMLQSLPGSDQAKMAHMEMLSADRFKNAMTVLVNDAIVARKEADMQRRLRG
jgi:hypothetical protein